MYEIYIIIFFIAFQKEKNNKDIYILAATQTPGQNSGSTLPVIIVSVALNILLIAVLVLIVIVFIVKAWRKTGTDI